MEGKSPSTFLWSKAALNGGSGKALLLSPAKAFVAADQVTFPWSEFPRPKLVNNCRTPVSLAKLVCVQPAE